MEEKLEGMVTFVHQSHEHVPNQDSGQENALSASVEGEKPEKQSSIKSVSCNLGGSNREIGNYGPWMLVKKQPRKMAPGKNKDNPSLAKSSLRGNFKNGSRFDLLQEDEVKNDDNIQDGQGSDYTNISHQQGQVGQSSQDKRKQLRNPANLKSTPHVPTGTVNPKMKLLNSTSVPPMKVDNQIQKSISNPSVLEDKRKQEQELLHLMRIMSKEGGGKGNIAQLQNDYLAALGIGVLEPKPLDIINPGSGTKYIGPKPPDIKSEDNSAMVICQNSDMNIDTVVQASSEPRAPTT
ncbi:hypothetical protein SESBI_11017 [Sesbania bispinosa]|nr:hypothetical protein SESBI_11017 [Sesbania bispinosa]